MRFIPAGNTMAQVRDSKFGDVGIVRSIAEELKKVAYVGAAGPYVVLGEASKTVVGGATLIAVSLVWFIICQTVAHLLMALDSKMEETKDE